MKNSRSYIIVSILHFISSLFCYIAAIINFINNGGFGVLYLCLGSTFLCLGAVWLNIYKNKQDKDNK